MRNKKFQMLELLFAFPCQLKFISETLKDREKFFDILSETLSSNNSGEK